MTQSVILRQSDPKAAHGEEFVTMRVAGQLFGISVLKVQDVLRGLKVTRVPLAPVGIIGVLNLRGRIVTAIDMRQWLGLPATPFDPADAMSVVVESGNGEYYSLRVDAVGEVITVPIEEREKPSAHLSARWLGLTEALYRLPGELLVILDVSKLFTFERSS